MKGMYRVWAQRPNNIYNAEEFYERVACFAYLGEASEWARDKAAELGTEHVIVGPGGNYITTWKDEGTREAG